MLVPTSISNTLGKNSFAKGLLCALIIPLLLEGQGGVNRVNGLITDQSGAVVPSAAVTARELATNVSTVTKTNDQGYYLLQLPVGTYDIKVSNAGFQSAVREKVTVNVGADRPEFFNVLNNVNFNAPTTDLNNLAFGKITSAGSSRQGQVSATVSW